MKDTIEIRPKSPRSRWVAISLDEKSDILSEGIKLAVVAKKAEKTGKLFSLQYMPKANRTYIL